MNVSSALSCLNRLVILRLTGVILMVGTGWAFFEWLFFVTKPSFMSLYPVGEKLSVLAGASLFISLALLVASLPFLVVGLWLTVKINNPLPGALVALTPASVAAALAMLVMIDNFSLTIFSGGVRDSFGVSLFLYRLLTVELLVLSGWLLLGFFDGRQSRRTWTTLTTISALILASSFPLIWLVSDQWMEKSDEPAIVAKDRPNIIILSGDGLSANHMSLYGYHRSTTPFMDSIRNELLIAENHFANASDTGGAVISLLTGKLPTTTRVIYPPDALRGRDSFEHLPGVLKKLGYFNADISMRHYADPYDLNLRAGFDLVNFRQPEKNGGPLVAALRHYPALNPTSQLVDRMLERLSERFGHVWMNRKMPNPLKEVNVPERRWVRDTRRMEEIRKFLETATQPFFLNVHMMGTHGKLFKPRQRVFSSEEDQKKTWDPDSYDDAILDFDHYVEEAYSLLEHLGLLSSTILIVSSDHGFRHNPLDRLPMLLRLPGGKRAGKIPGITQRLDIAPTILNAMGVERPGWLEGDSMIQPGWSGESRRKVFAVASKVEKSANGIFWSVETPTAPWYSLGRLTLIQCNQGFRLRVKDLQIVETKIEGSTLDCPDQISLEEARVMMHDHLRKQGYLPE